MTVPTADNAQALYAFMMERADEEHAAIINAISDDTLSPEAAAPFFRISNSNKFGIEGLTAYILDLLKSGDAEQAALAWDRLTAAGEEWRDHPDYLTDWENAQRAEIRRQLAGG